MYSNATVKHILDRKGSQVWSVDPEASVMDALAFMAQKNIGAVVVMSDEELVGIFSERDYARKVVLAGKDERETQVREVMTSQVICVSPNHLVDQCLALMTGKFIRHLPVIGAGGRVSGVVSIGDVVKEMIAEQEFVIDQLVHYVTGDQPMPPVPDRK